MVRVNNLANLEALHAVLAGGLEVLGATWQSATMPLGFARDGEAQSKALLGKLEEIRKLVERAIPNARDGREVDGQLEEIDFRLKDASRAAERIRASWPRPRPGADDSATRFLQILADAGDVTVGPDPLGASNWLVASARDANLFS